MSAISLRSASINSELLPNVVFLWILVQKQTNRAKLSQEVVGQLAACSLQVSLHSLHTLFACDESFLQDFQFTSKPSTLSSPAEFKKFRKGLLGYFEYFYELMQFNTEQILLALEKMVSDSLAQLEAMIFKVNEVNASDRKDREVLLGTSPTSPIHLAAKAVISLLLLQNILANSQFIILKQEENSNLFQFVSGKLTARVFLLLDRINGNQPSVFHKNFELALLLFCEEYLVLTLGCTIVATSP